MVSNLRAVDTEQSIIQQLASLIQEQNNVLKELRDSFDKKERDRLGFHSESEVHYIYCNRSNGGLWYTIKNETVANITETSLTGYVKGVEFKIVERKNKEVRKLIVKIQADRLYFLESGADSHFSKCVLAAISEIGDSIGDKPITLRPKPADDDSVLFCSTYFDGDYVKAHYDSETDWGAIEQKVLSFFGEGDRPVSVVQPIAAPQQNAAIARLSALRELTGHEKPQAKAIALSVNLQTKDAGSWSAEDCDRFRDALLLDWGARFQCWNHDNHRINGFEKVKRETEWSDDATLFANWANYVTQKQKRKDAATDEFEDVDFG